MAELAQAVEDELAAILARLTVIEAALSAVIDDLQYDGEIEYEADVEGETDDEYIARVTAEDAQLDMAESVQADQVKDNFESESYEHGEVGGEEDFDPAADLEREAAAREAAEIHDGSTHDRSIERQARLAQRAAEGIDEDGPRAFVAGVGASPAPGEDVILSDHRVSSDPTEGRQLQAPRYPEGEDGSVD